MVNRPLVIPWVVIHETFSIEPTSVMYAQPVAPFELYIDLWVKLYKLCRVKISPDSRVLGQWTRYELLTMISRGVNSLMREKGCV